MVRTVSRKSTVVLDFFGAKAGELLAWHGQAGAPRVYKGAVAQRFGVRSAVMYTEPGVGSDENPRSRHRASFMPLLARRAVSCQSDVLGSYSGTAKPEGRKLWGRSPTYAFSKPWLVNFSVRLFSVTVRTT